MGVLFFFSGKTQSCLTKSHYWCEVHEFTWWDVVIYLRKKWWTSSGQICSSQGGSHLCHFESKKKKKSISENFLLHGGLAFCFHAWKIIAALWRKGHEKAEMWITTRVQINRRVCTAGTWAPAKTKTKENETKVQAQHQLETRTVSALSPNLPYVGKDYVHITSANRNQVGDDESAGGPHDQERRQEAETLREPKHLGWWWWW